MNRLQWPTDFSHGKNGLFLTKKQWDEETAIPDNEFVPIADCELDQLQEESVLNHLVTYGNGASYAIEYNIDTGGVEAYKLTKSGLKQIAKDIAHDRSN
jgi:hypothetical protein